MPKWEFDGAYDRHTAAQRIGSIRLCGYEVKLEYEQTGNLQPKIKIFKMKK